MSFRTLGFWVGLFSLVVGFITYDKTVSTSPFPIIIGGFVMILAITGLLPEFKKCQSCGKKIPKKLPQCTFCGANQDVSNP